MINIDSNQGRIGELWWIPQKWQACERLYDNKPAQIFCLLASK